MHRQMNIVMGNSQKDSRFSFMDKASISMNWKESTLDQDNMLS